VSATLTAADLLEVFAEFERRALELYRHFAQTFAGNAAAARIWRSMSDAEAGHFAVLRLAEDRLPRVGAPAGPKPAIDQARLDEWKARLEELEAKGKGPGLAPADAAEITLTWEREELPRLLTLLAALPEPARKATALGLVQGAEEHLGCLEDLLKTVGRDSLLPEISLLMESVARLKLLATG